MPQYHRTVEESMQRIKAATAAIEEDLACLEQKNEGASQTAARMRRVTANSDVIAADLEFVEAWRDAVALAYYERTGEELEIGTGEFTQADAERADEIVRAVAG